MVIGCDGAHSTVRKHMIQLPLFNYSQMYIDHGYLEISLPSNENQVKREYKLIINKKILHYNILGYLVSWLSSHLAERYVYVDSVAEQRQILDLHFIYANG